MTEALATYRTMWERKPALRHVYEDFYDRIAQHCVAGRTLEIGGGIGNLKARLPDVVTSDIQPASWLDLVADAQSLPFGAGTFGNVVMVDVLHHLEFPLRFFREAARVLRPGGRIVMVEPAITWGSTLFYRFIHHEPVRMRDDPLVDGEPDPHRDPYDSNQAIPTLIVTRDRARFERAMPMLKIKNVSWFSLALYPLTGGFKPWSLVPGAAVPAGLRLEKAIEPVVGSFLAFRMLIAIERIG